MLVDKNGSAVILKNNVLRYIIMEIPVAEEVQNVPDEYIASISKRLIEKN